MKENYLLFVEGECNGSGLFILLNNRHYLIKVINYDNEINFIFVG